MEVVHPFYNRYVLSWILKIELQEYAKFGSFIVLDLLNTLVNLLLPKAIHFNGEAIKVHFNNFLKLVWLPNCTCLLFIT